MFYIIFAFLYIFDIINKAHIYIIESSFSIKNICIRILAFFQTMIDFLWSSIGIQRDSMNIIIENKAENFSPITERIYTFHVIEKRSVGNSLSIMN
jgi:hypothetical protein